jgi:hypothetical protein
VLPATANMPPPASSPASDRQLLTDVVTDRRGGVGGVTALQAALPRRTTSTTGTGARARAGAALRVVLRRAASRRLGEGPAGSPWSTSRARACSSPRRDGACARSTTSAGTAGRRWCRRPEREPPRRAGRVAALPVPLVDLRPRGRLLRAPHTEDVRRLRPRRVRAAPGRRRHLGAASSSCT